MGRIHKAPSNVEWRQWGAVDPFYGVASWSGRDRSGLNPWTVDDFYALGQSDWADFRERWARYGVKYGRVVDVGCGAGRLTKHMATDFSDVVGVDVSDGMIDVARAHVTDANVQFRLGDGIRLPIETATVDGAFSAHVFQHLESLDLARANFAEVARVLRPGGTMMIHLPVVLPPTGLPGVLPAMAAKRKLSDLRAVVQRWRGAPLMRGLQFPWAWLRGQLPTLGLVDVELVIFATRSNGADHACVLARRLDG
jgi:SAM-dependent methyltransferase